MTKADQLDQGKIRTGTWGTYHLTEEDREYLKSKAVNGIISANDYIDAMQHIGDFGKGKRERKLQARRIDSVCAGASVS